jgi:DNA mismatch repair protein MutS
VEGGTEHSFGIHVAKMAGMPGSILSRAEHILVELEKKETEIGGRKPRVIAHDPMQLSIFEHVDPLAAKVKEMIEDLNINELTPVECMFKLIEIKKLMDEEG